LFTGNRRDGQRLEVFCPANQLERLEALDGVNQIVSASRQRRVDLIVGEAQALAQDVPGAIDKERPDRFRRLCFRGVAEGAISDSKAAELLGISVRELDRQLEQPA